MFGLRSGYVELSEHKSFLVIFFFILDSCLANFWERNCPFGFLLVMFLLWCRCFKCVLLSLCFLGRTVLGNCIESDHCLPFFYDRRDDFIFSVVNFPKMCSKSLSVQAYDVYVSQLTCYTRTCFEYQECIERGRLPTTRVST